MKEIKIYGLYPGRLSNDTDYISKCSEFELFNVLNAYYKKTTTGEQLKYYQKMVEFYTRLEEKTLAHYFQIKIDSYYEMDHETRMENEYTLDYCMIQTQRFGVDIDYNLDGRVQKTDSFKVWFYSWCNYLEIFDNDSYSKYSSSGKECLSLDGFTLPEIKTVTFPKHKEKTKQITV